MPVIKTVDIVILSRGVRGRARLHVPALRRHPALAFHLRERLCADERVRSVHASAVTGNVLVEFDADRLLLADVRREIARAAATCPLIRTPRFEQVP